MTVKLPYAPPDQRDVILSGIKLLDKHFNGDAKGNDRPWALVLLVAPFGEKSGRANYASNGVDRRDMIKFLRETADRFEAQQIQSETIINVRP